MSSRIERSEGVAGARSLAAQLGPIADRIRQDVAVGMGVRPYRVFMTTTRWTGEERGDGREEVVSCVELVPRPRVREVTNFQNLPFPAGVLERGVLRIDGISTSYREDDFEGGRGLGRNESFFWELVLDGRSGTREQRRRCRFLGASLHPGEAQWVAYVERTDEDRDRDGDPGSRADAESP